MRAAALALFLALGACSGFPELEGTIPADVENADYPDLVPLEPLLARAAPAVADPVETSAALDARVAALRARANALQRRAILNNGTRTRLNPASN